MALTRAQIRAKLYNRVDGLGFASTADNVTATTIVDTFQLQDDEASAGDKIGTFIYRPGRTGDDRVKPASTLDPATGTLEHGSNNYSNTADLAWESVGLMTPDELNDCIRRAMRRVYALLWVAVSPWTDGDFAASDASAFTDSGTTSSKDTTTANYHLNGPRSLVQTGAGTTRTSVFGVTPGDIFFHGGLNRVTASTYTVSYKLYDETNGALILSDADVEHSSLAWQMVYRRDVIPAGCYAVRAQLQVAGSGTPVAVWDTLFGHLVGEEQRRFRAPSWLDESWKLLDFGPAEYGRLIEAGRYNAASQKRHAWHRPSEFDIDPLTEDAAPRWLQINREEGLPEQDLWIYGKRQLSDYAEMDDETDSTDGPEDLIIAACLAEIGETCWYRYGETRWQIMWRENEARLLSQKAAQTKAVPPREVESYTPGGRR